MTYIDIGNTVRHLPTGEKWVMACVEGNDLSWLGWPEGWAKLSDCELVEKAMPEVRTKILEILLRMSNKNDHRHRYAKSLSELTQDNSRRDFL